MVYKWPKPSSPLGVKRNSREKQSNMLVTKIENEENETSRTNSTTKMTVIYKSVMFACNGS